jgi:hypothetical protein
MPSNFCYSIMCGEPRRGRQGLELLYEHIHVTNLQQLFPYCGPSVSHAYARK